MSMSAALAAKIAAAKKVGPNMNEAQKGGGFEVIPEGKVVKLRFVTLIEGGTHVEQHGQYKGSKKDKVMMTFELSGGKDGVYDPRDIKGEKVPYRISLGGSFGINYSLNEKAHFFKLFRTMADCHPEVNATIMAELIGKEFLGTIKHKVTDAGTPKEKRYPEIHDIRKAERDATGEGDMVPVEVPEPITKPLVYLRDVADLNDWNALFIDGTFDDKKDAEGNVIQKGKSKNVLQEFVMRDINFASTPVGMLLAAGVKDQSEADALEAALDEAGNAVQDDDTPPFPTDSADEPDLSQMGV